MNKQVRRPGPKGTPQPSTGKTSWFQSASGLAVATSALFVHSLCHQNCQYLPPHFLLLSLSRFPSQVCHAVSCSRTHHRSRQDGASAGIAGVGRGQCQVSTVAFLFLEGRQCVRYTCTASTAKHSIFREQIIILSACPLKPPQSFYSLSQC